MPHRGNALTCPTPLAFCSVGVQVIVSLLLCGIGCLAMECGDGGDPACLLRASEEALRLCNVALSTVTMSGDPHRLVASAFQAAGVDFNGDAPASDVVQAADTLRPLLNNARVWITRNKTNKGALTRWRRTNVAIALPRTLFKKLAAAAEALQAAAEATAAAEARADAEARRLAAAEAQLAEATAALEDARANAAQREHAFRIAVARIAEKERELAAADERFAELLDRHSKLRTFAVHTGLIASRRPRMATPCLRRNQRRKRFSSLATGFLRVYREDMRVEDERELVPVSLVLEDTHEHRIVFVRLDDDAPGRASHDPPEQLRRDEAFARGAIGPRRLARARVIMAVYDACGMTSRMYHQMAQVQTRMERFYVLVKAKKQMDAEMAQAIPFECLTESNHKVVGVRVNFERKLRYVVRLLVKENVLTDQQRILVKLSGDGRPVTRKTGHVMLTFAVMQEGRNVWKPDHNYTIAVYEGKEDYDRLAVEFAAIQHVIDNVKEIEECGKKFGLQWVFASDWKFLAEAFGASTRATLHIRAPQV